MQCRVGEHCGPPARRAALACRSLSSMPLFLDTPRGRVKTEMLGIDFLQFLEPPPWLLDAKSEVSLSSLAVALKSQLRSREISSSLPNPVDQDIAIVTTGQERVRGRPTVCNIVDMTRHSKAAILQTLAANRDWMKKAHRVRRPDSNTFSPFSCT